MALHAMSQAAGDAIIVADGEGHMLLWNPDAERLFGFRATEVVGDSLDLMIPERCRERHGTGYQTVRQNRQTRYGT